MTNQLIILPILIGFLSAFGCGGEKTPTLLVAENIDTPIDDSTGVSGSGDPAGGAEEEEGVSVDSLFSTDLFNAAWLSLAKFGGAVDPVGTNLMGDFDGDGILNTDETAGNIWVADYPEISTNISPPITMEIKLLDSSNSDSETISSDISSDDMESRKNEGSEKFHQNEHAVRTAQYEKEIQKARSNSTSRSEESSSSSSDSNSSSKSGEVSVSSLVYKASVKASSSKSESHSESRSDKNSSSDSSSAEDRVRTQVFEDRPFKNNIDRNAGTVKSDSASKKARKFRKESKEKSETYSKKESNAGFVRASLFIHNHSINMPVRISNILCSLLFETPQGELRPVQSFRLRNDDYSIFEIEVYGGSEFGPYVVELKNLNTAEIEAALLKGYTPKIFIIDYQMTHVDDSNYKQALSESFTGNNLRIIEENAKGRTALLKLIGPNMRQIYRTAAFSTELKTMGGGKICNPDDIDTDNERIKAGVSMRVALERLKCSGVNVEFEHYVYDYKGTADEIIQQNLPDNDKKFYIYTYGIKSINGIQNNIPCAKNPMSGEEVRLSVMGIDPNSRNTIQYTQVNACHVQLSELTEEERFFLSAWSVFANGKYFDDTKIVPDVDATIAVGAVGATVLECTDHCKIFVTEGLESTIWVGDNYDIVYMSLLDINAKQNEFGTNPLETGASLSMNTKWNLEGVGYDDIEDYAENKDNEYHNYSKINSIYLGKAALGEQIELVFKLNQTRYLKPDFGTPTETTSGGNVYHEFSYAHEVEERKEFEIDEAIDFEINLGVDRIWHNILRDVGTDSMDEDALHECKDGENNFHKIWNLREQIFTVCVELPTSYKGVSKNGTADVYLRPVLNNAYRNSVWPQQADKINRFEGFLNEPAEEDATSIEVTLAKGTIPDDGDTLTIGGNPYTISGTPSLTAGVYTITLSSRRRLKMDHLKGEKVYVSAGLNKSLFGFFVEDNYINTWNFSVPGSMDGYGFMSAAYSPMSCDNSNPYFAPSQCLGYNPEPIVANWLGNLGFGNNWADSSRYTSLMATGSLELLFQNDDGRALGGLRRRIKQIATGYRHTCVLFFDGNVQCWGRNQYGQLGDGTNNDRLTPAVDVVGLDGMAIAIETGRYHTCAVMQGGSVQCWGYNQYGQLGNGLTAHSNVPVVVRASSNPAAGDLLDVSAISAGHYHTCAVVVNDSVKCWGRNISGELGNGTTNNSNVPVSVRASLNPYAGNLPGVSAISVGGSHTCVVLNNAAKCWGLNNFGQLSSTHSGGISNVPVQVSTLTSGVDAISAGERHSCVLVNGSVKCWGSNYYGQLGDGTRSDSSVPVPVTGLTGVDAISRGGYHTCALVNGSVQCWGRNLYGQLGDGTAINRFTPVSVRASLDPLDGNLSGVSVISGVGSHNCALVNGFFQCWGLNNRGQLGDGTTTNRSTPVFIKFSVPKTHLFSSPLIERDYTIRTRVR